VPVDLERTIDDELRLLLAEFDASRSVEDDARICGAMRTLAHSDVDGYARALARLESPSARSDAIEPLVLEERFDPSFEPIVDTHADLLDAELATHGEPGSDAAYQAALGYLVLGDISSETATPEILDRLRPRAEALLRHRHPDVRAAGVALVADFASKTDARSYESLRVVLETDPDPVVRDAAYSELDFFGAVPAGVRRPVRPRWFRGLRRYLAGG